MELRALISLTDSGYVHYDVWRDQIQPPLDFRMVSLPFNSSVFIGVKILNSYYKSPIVKSAIRWFTAYICFSREIVLSFRGDRLTFFLEHNEIVDRLLGKRYIIYLLVKLWVIWVYMWYTYFCLQQIDWSMVVTHTFLPQVGLITSLSLCARDSWSLFLDCPCTF